VEAIRRTGGGAYVAAVQWHPEFHQPGSPDNFDDTAMLQDFLTAARALKG
jgi:putative glutamine amidotransferase